MRASSSFAGSHLLDRVGFVRQIVVRYERAHGAGWLQVEVVSEVANVSSEMCIGKTMQGARTGGAAGSLR